MDLYGQFGDPADKARFQIFGLADEFDLREALQDFLPQDLKLHFAQPVAHTPVNAKTKAQMVPGIRPVDQKFIRARNSIFISVAGTRTTCRLCRGV